MQLDWCSRSSSQSSGRDYPWQNGYQISFLWTKIRELFESASIFETWIKLSLRTTFWLHTSIILSITVLGVSSCHIWMDFLSTIRLRYFPLISIRQHLYTHGEPFPTGSYLLALQTMGPHSSMPCPMHFMTLRTLWSLTSTISLCIHSYGNTILDILETFSWDVAITKYSWTHTNLFFALKWDVC